MGIHTSSPAASLEVDGISGTTLKIVDGNQGAGRVLTSDAAGQASWQPALAGSGTLNSVPKFTPNGTTIGNSSIFDNGNVGIGTANPTNVLKVARDAGNPGLIRADAQLELGGLTDQTKVLRLGFNTTDNYGFIGATIWGATVSPLLLNQGGGNVGIGTSAPAYRLDVNGDVNVNGTYRQNGSVFTSDIMFKTNIDSISNASGLIGQFKPRTFYFDTTNIYGLHFNNKKQYGIIAQDAEQVLPELVSTTFKPATYDSTGALATPAVTYKVLNYNAFTALLIKGMQEQRKKIDSLKTKTINQDSLITGLQNQISTCCRNSEKKLNNTPNQKLINDSLTKEIETLKRQMAAFSQSLEQCCFNYQQNTGINNAGQNPVDIDRGALEQNAPNPFSQSTRIKYYVSAKANTASINIYDLQGKEIKKFELLQKGNGSVIINGGEIYAGIFMYTLIIDGREIDTKKMILTK